MPLLRRPHPILTLILWGSCALAGAAWAWSAGISPQEIPARISTLVALAGPWAKGAYLLLHLVRPVVLIPPAWLAIAGGVAFGPWVGALLAVVGNTLSTWIVFSVARANLRASAEAREGAFLRKVSTRLEHHGLETMVLLRLLPLPIPSDLLSTVGGISRMRRRDFVASSILGGGPEVAAYALLGPSVHDPRLLLVIGGIALLVFGAIVLLRRCGHCLP